jgi:SAM-dependent methyltransferase
VLKAAAKGALLLGLGWAPGGPELYQRVAWEILGTQATHVDKLVRVTPGYCQVWDRVCGLGLEGLDLWIHDAGGTPFWALAGHLLTGRPVQLTNAEARVLDRHLPRAVLGVLGMALPRGVGTEARRDAVSACRWLDRSAQALERMGATLHEGVQPQAIPIDDASVDLSHSGGALEHMAPAALAAFLAECHRVLRPGGVASHIFDHRDHLHHADRALPFLAHLGLPEPVYRALRGHPLGYHSRLTPTQVAAAFEAAGFEPIAQRRLVIPARRYVDDAVASQAEPGLPRWLLAEPHRGISDLDLRTAACHYLYRKPARALSAAGPGPGRPPAAG